MNEYLRRLTWPLQNFFYNNFVPKDGGMLPEVTVTAPAPGRRGQPYILRNNVVNFISGEPAWQDDLIFDEVPYYDDDGLLQTPIKVGRNNQFGTYNYFYLDPSTNNYINDDVRGKEIYDSYMKKKPYRLKSRTSY